MVEANLKNWILSFDELRVLLFSLGFDKNEGILMKEKNFSESEVLQIMHQLSQKELIVFAEDSLEVVPELKEYLNVIGRPEYSEIVTGADGHEYYVYLGTDHAVVTDRYWQKKDAIRLSGMSFEQYREWRENVR